MQQQKSINDGSADAVKGNTLLSVIERHSKSQDDARSRRLLLVAPFRGLQHACASFLDTCAGAFSALKSAPSDSLNDFSLEHFFNRVVEFVMTLAILLARLREFATRNNLLIAAIAAILLLGMACGRNFYQPG